ncbi:hypothetical protein D7Z54_32720 [Salibacterium salarium]|uniref:Uncharacterized protein n=1 Tax=Salibacterium salarium TaxID=284579 RepID=A0A3R9R7X9_9BACI|nr:hypothetical protein D7Z54_32720 [Salibacterium salarium]
MSSKVKNQLNIELVMARDEEGEGRPPVGVNLSNKIRTERSKFLIGNGGSSTMLGIRDSGVKTMQQIGAKRYIIYEWRNMMGWEVDREGKINKKNEEHICVL